MIARTSRLRTSKETSCSALTPPNDSDTPSTDRTTSPMRPARASRWTCGALIASRGFSRRGGREGLLVVGVELLVQDQEAVDLRVGDLRLPGDVGVHFFHAFAHQLVDLVARGEVGVPGVGQVAPLGPVADGIHVDVEEGAHHAAAVAEADRFLDGGEKLELVLEVL